MRLLLKLKLLMRKPQERQELVRQEELEVTENNNYSKQTNKKKDLTKKLTN